MIYPDESSKTGVWRVLRASEFGDWLQAQKVPSTIRYIIDHHTWSPSTTPQDPEKFKAQVLGIFRNYYEVPKANGGRGWARDHGPHLFLGVIAGEPWVVIAANLSVHGPQCAFFNACSVGIETMWNGDKTPWSEPILRGLYEIHKAFEQKCGIPFTYQGTGTNRTVPTSTGRGWLFHRDAKDSNKSCPGTKNTRTLLESAFERFASGQEEEDMTEDEIRRIAREEAGKLIEQVYDDDEGEKAEAYLLQEGILTKKHPQTRAASIRYMNITMARLIKYIYLVAKAK